MIARMWRARTRPGMGGSYLPYFRQTGLREFAETPGFRGALTLRRELGGESEYVILSLWDDLDAVRRFAGPEADRAVYYPEDAVYFPQSELRERLEHYEIVAAAPDLGAAVAAGVAEAGGVGERDIE